MNRKSAVHRFSMMLAGILLSFALLFTMLPTVVFAAGEPEEAPTAGWNREVLDFTETAIGAEEGWQYYFANNGIITYTSSAAYMEIAEGAGVDGGNALHAVRKSGAPQEFVLYSRHNAVKPSTMYEISAQVKVIGEGCVLQMTRNERMAGTTEKDAQETYAGTSAETTVTNTEGKWQKVSYTFRTVSGTAQMGAKMLFNAGVGEVYVDEIMIREVTNADEVTTAPNYGWRLYGWGKGVKDTGIASSSSTEEKWEQLSPMALSEESSDNDGASLSLTGGMFVKTMFGALAKRNEDTTYTLSFKYKGGNEGSNIKVRMDGYTTDGTAFYWVTGEGQPNETALTGAADDWTEFSYTFKARNGSDWREIVFVTLGATGGDYLIDEVSLVCNDADDPMQYIQNGSFTSWIELDEQVVLESTTSVAEMPDGSYVYTAGNQAPRGVGSMVNDANTTVGYNRGYIRMWTDGMDLSQKYKLSYEYRGGIWQNTYVENGSYPDNTYVMYNDNTATGGRGSEKNNGWSTAESDFIELKDSVLIYGDSANEYTAATQTYIRNIKFTGEDGTEYKIANPAFKDYSQAPAPEYGANVFTYGDFEELTFPETDWELTGGAKVRGYVNEYAESKQYRLALDGESKVVSPAVSIAAAKEDTFARVMFAFESEGDLNVTLLTQDDEVLEPLGEMQTQTISEVNASIYGQFRIPEGTTSLRIVIENTNNYYISLQYVSVMNGGIGLETHVHTFVADDDAEHPAKTEEATCQHGGTSSKYCSDCGEYVVLESTPKSDHHWSDWEVIEAATCVTTGRQQRTCEDCGEREIEITQPTGEHTYENGVCTVCGAVDPNAGTTDPGKDPGTDPGKDPGDDGEEGGGCSGAAAGAGAAIALPLLGAAVFAVVKRKRN